MPQIAQNTSGDEYTMTRWQFLKKVARISYRQGERGYVLFCSILFCSARCNDINRTRNQDWIRTSNYFTTFPKLTFSPLIFRFISSTLLSSLFSPPTLFSTVFLSSHLLYCTITYCTVLSHTILYCTMTYYTVLSHTILYYDILYCTVLLHTILYYHILCCTITYCTVLSHTVQYILYCIVLYCTITY